MAQPAPYVYEEALVVRVVDGDTVVLRLSRRLRCDYDLGFHVVGHVEHEASTVQSFRLKGIDTPEIHGDSREKAGLAKAALEALLAAGKLRVETYKPDKYGRWLCVIFVQLADGTTVNVNDRMIEAGHAKAYNP